MTNLAARATGFRTPELITAVYDAYSDWMSEFCKTNPDRLAGLTCLSPTDPNIAAAQLRRASELGLRGAEINVAAAVNPLYHKSWDVLWEAADETGLPISFHTVGLTPRGPKAEELEDYYWVVNGVMITLFQLAGGGVPYRNRLWRSSGPLSQPQIRAGRVWHSMDPLRAVSDGRRVQQAALSPGPEPATERILGSTGLFPLSRLST